MTRSISALVTAAALMATACGDSDSPTAPGGPGSDTFFTATIEGQAFTATVLVALTNVNDGRASLSVVATNGCGSGATQIALNANKLDSPTLATGTYSTSKSIQTQTSGGATTTHRELTVSLIQNNQNWIAPSITGSGSGTLTITSLAGGYVEGSLSSVAVPDFGNSSGTNRTVTGSFRAKIEDKRIC